MFANGTSLKKIRNNNNISLKKIKKEIGIADSKLSRIENNEDKTGLTINEAYRMSKLFKMSFLQFLLEAEFIDYKQLSPYCADFLHMELLSDSDKIFIQKMIDYIVKSHIEERG